MRYLGHSILVIQYSPHAPVGDLGDWCRSKGFEIFENTSDRLSDALDRGDYDAVILLGSAESVANNTLEWIANDLIALKKCIENRIPVFGICFGAQMIATALGGVVRTLNESELGWFNLPTGIDIISRGGPWFQWHHDWISLQDKTWILAGDKDRIQAFRKDNAIGLQFHPEVTEEIVNMWLDLNYDNESQVLGLEEKVVKGNKQNMGGNRERSFQLYDYLFSLFEFKQEKRVFSSETIAESE